MTFQIPVPKKMEHRPVVIGSGPAGLFCAYLLAEHGYRPVVYERGASVEERKKDVERFWNEQILNPNSNVQFGEGGAGTFSDGKLNTTCQRSSWKEPESAGNLCGKRCAKGHPVQS